MSLKASTCSSSYSMSAALSRLTIRQKTQSVTRPSGRAAIIWRSHTGLDDKEWRHGDVPEVQTTDSQERQSREARCHVVPQVLSRAPREEVLSVDAPSLVMPAPSWRRH